MQVFSLDAPEVQKDAPARLREALKEEKLRSEEFKQAAQEARRALDLCLADTNRSSAEIHDMKTLLQDGAALLRRAETAMDDHMPTSSSNHRLTSWRRLLALERVPYCGPNVGGIGSRFGGVPTVANPDRPSMS